MLLIYYQIIIITLDVAVLYGGTVAIGTILFETLISSIVNNSLAPKAVLQIKDITLGKKSFNDIEVYFLTAIVTNKGKKITANLDSTVDIRDENNQRPALLYVTVSELNGSIVHVDTRKQPFETDKYAWVDAQSNEHFEKWGQIRQNDEIKLHFPIVRHFGAVVLDDPVDYSHYDVLQLEKNKRYNVTIVVKGETSEKVTVSQTISKEIVAY